MLRRHPHAARAVQGQRPGRDRSAGRPGADHVQRHVVGDAAYQGRQAAAAGGDGCARSPAVPEVPTIAESGYPGFEASAWYGVLAPAGTPKAVVTRLNTEILRALKIPEVKDRLENVGFEIVGGTPEAFGAYMKSEIAKWAKVVKASASRPNEAHRDARPVAARAGVGAVVSGEAGALDRGVVAGQRGRHRLARHRAETLRAARPAGGGRQPRRRRRQSRRRTRGESAARRLHRVHGDAGAGHQHRALPQARTSCAIFRRAPPPSPDRDQQIVATMGAAQAQEAAARIIVAQSAADKRQE